MAIYSLVDSIDRDMVHSHRLKFPLLTCMIVFLSAFSEESCSPNRFYCGSQVPQVPSIFQNKTLWQCGFDGKSFIISFNCKWGCKIIKHDNSYCLCLQNASYCGYELNDIGWQGYENHSVYECNDEGLNASLTENCPHQCKVASESYCSRPCQDGQNYCGNRLKELGWDGYENDTLYQCRDGNETRVWSKCSPGTCDSHYCKCNPDQYYCGHELYDQMGWTNFKSRKQELFKCAPNGSLVFNQYVCQKCISGHLRPTCECRGGEIYCGHSLHTMGWDGYENDTLYQCHGGNNETSVWSTCSPGTCYSNTCNCIPGQYYCGHELYEQLGWTNYKSRQQELFKCAPNGRATWIADCSKCNITGTALILSGDQHLTCNCKTGDTYCGYTLQEMGLDGYDNGTLYLCEEGQNGSFISKLMACGDGKCRYNGACEYTRDKLYCGHELYQMGWRTLSVRNQARLARSINGTHVLWIASCNNCNNTRGGSKCDCIPGILYCGSRINQIGYTGYSNDSIYICENDLSLTDTGETNVLCSKGCTPARSYCGYEVQYIWDIATDDLQMRYVCNEDKSLRSTAQCTNCISNGNGAYCQCIPGWRYCASTLFKTGWNGFDKTISHLKNFTNDTIFLCKDEETVEYIETCARNECQLDADALPHCLCSPNRTYCGHELYERYNSGDTYLYPHYIYRCSRTRLSVIEEVKCGNCYRQAGVPTCRQECSIGQYYCGSDLLLLEGWQNSDALTNWLYRCDNSTTAQPIEECLAGCVSNSSITGQDAFCSPYSTPWYWFFGGIAVPLVIIGLGFLLIRSILKHRRLKKFLEEQRIDVSQLTTIKILGEGEFGEVWQGSYRNTDGILRDVALKLSKEKTDAASKLACANCFLQEVVALDIVKHKNVIKVFGICLNFKDQFGNSVPALVLEFMNGGSAISYMRSERNRLNGRDLLHIFLDICQAGDHLCKLGIIHRDIGARNVLVQKDPHTGHVVVAKLTDFGLAKDIGKLTSMYKAANLDQNMFHFRYTAPEGFRGCFCSKSDVWSFAVFMWELYTVKEEQDALADLRLEQGRSGPMPYSELDTVAYVLTEACSDRKLKKPLMAPEKMYNIMRQCWETQEDLRPSFGELIKFFNTNCDGSEIQPKAAVLDVSHKNRDSENGYSENQVEHNAIPQGYVSGWS